MDKGSNYRGSSEAVRRRKFLKGATAAGIALTAGCTGSGEGGQETTTVGDASQSQYDGLTIQYWNRFHNNSAEAADAIRQAISEFENDTGATVEVNYSTGEPAQQWLTLAREGRRPHIMDQVSGQVGPFVELEIAKPFSEYRNLFSDDLVEHTSWLMDSLGEQAYSGFGGEAYEFKFSSEPSRLFLARRDHLEEAGLSPEDDFPPESYEHSLEIGRTLQEEGPADNGWQIYGSDGDVTDTCTEDWPVARAGNAGKIMNEDWSDTQIDDEPIKWAYENFVAIFTEHELSSRGTVSMSDEDATQLLIRGDASMTQVPAATYADLLGQAEDQVMNGDFIFGAPWKGESGARGIIGGDGVVFVNPPEGANVDEWNRRQEAAADLLENYLYFSDEFQRRMFSTIGGGPARDDVSTDAIRGAVDDPAGYEQTNILQASETGTFDHEEYYFQSAAPMFGQIQYEIMPGYIQQAMQGQISVSDALDQAAQEARDQFFS